MNKLSIYDQRMIDLMNYCIAEGLADNRKDFLEKIGFAHANNLSPIMAGNRSFTNDHILEAGKVFKVNINWIYGLESNMWREDKKVTVIDKLKEAVRSVEQEFQKGSRITKKLTIGNR